MITYKDIQKNKEINAMIEQGNQVLKTLGYTEHSKKHAIKVAEHAAEILKITGADDHQIQFRLHSFLLIRPMCEEIVYKTQSLQILIFMTA